MPPLSRGPEACHFSGLRPATPRYRRGKETPHFPAAGEVVIFDRNWYNRAGVERVMEFCTEERTGTEIPDQRRTQGLDAVAQGPEAPDHPEGHSWILILPHLRSTTACSTVRG
ncbi:hypothetical protein [Azospirillum brasilense]|uniref:hypothetical protein n=1 Tax=Azospirillum brasilense TaxID=192 RepID=UPI003CE542C0